VKRVLKTSNEQPAERDLRRKRKRERERGREGEREREKERERERERERGGERARTARGRWRQKKGHDPKAVPAPRCMLNTPEVYAP